MSYFKNINYTLIIFYIESHIQNINMFSPIEEKNTVKNDKLKHIVISYMNKKVLV